MHLAVALDSESRPKRGKIYTGMDGIQKGPSSIAGCGRICGLKRLTIDGEAAPVLGKMNAPCVFLAKGRHSVDGRFVWY